LIQKVYTSRTIEQHVVNIIAPTLVLEPQVKLALTENRWALKCTLFYYSILKQNCIRKKWNTRTKVKIHHTNSFTT
jgi:hypothetical protein